MASTDDTRVPLLDSEEETLADILEDDVEVEFILNSPPRELGSGADKRPPRAHGSSLLKVRKKHYSGNEMIVAIFVVAFDTKKGNIVEWKYPEQVTLEGIEFKSMASGLHTVAKDFIYFKQHQLFGLSCFEKIPVASQEERGARMKTVGLLAVGYSDLHLHMDFLQRQVRIQVETPGEYGSLEEYFRHYRSPQQAAAPRPLSVPVPVPTEDLPSMTIMHPAGCFTQFLQFFGARIFLLWKLALLKKRIILFSPPPIGVVCYRVYCSCLLAAHCLPMDIETDCNPQFYVNVADIEQLQSLDYYIACTTEKIFQSKTQLYDVFVDNQNVTSHLHSLEPLLKLTRADTERFDHLNNIRSNQLMAVGGAGTENNDELGFAEFFQELNSQLFRTVSDAASSEDHILTVEMVSGVGLDPVKDRIFLTELAKVYDLNFTVQSPTDMFSCCL